MLMFAALVCLAVSAAVGGLLLLLVPSRLDQRLKTIESPGAKSDWTTTVAQAVGPFAGLMAPQGD